MPFDLSSLIGGSIGDAFEKIVGVFKVPPEQQLAAQTEITKIQLDLQGKLIDQIGAQIDVNKAEAASPRWWIAGARPAVIWVCVFALFYSFVLQPFAQFALVASHVSLPGPLPTINTSDLVGGLLLPLLGLSGMRTFEKVQGVVHKH